MYTFSLEKPRDSNPPLISTQFERSSIFQFLILRFEIYAKEKGTQFYWILIHSNCNIHFNTKHKVGNQPVLIIKIAIVPHLSY